MEFIFNSSTQLSALIHGRTKINQKAMINKRQVDLSVYQIGIKSVSDFINCSSIILPSCSKIIPCDKLVEYTLLTSSGFINIAGIWATCETFGLASTLIPATSTLGQKIVKHTQLRNRSGFLSLLSIICIKRVASPQGRFNAACHSSQEKRTSVYSVKHGKQKVRHVLKWNDDTERPWELVISTQNYIYQWYGIWLPYRPNAGWCWRWKNLLTDYFTPNLQGSGFNVFVLLHHLSNISLEIKVLHQSLGWKMADRSMKTWGVRDTTRWDRYMVSKSRVS